MDAATENASNTAFEYSTESAESEGFFASELDERSFLDLQPVHAIVYIALTVVALSVGSVGNLLIVACFVVNKALRKVGNEFLLNMAFSDLCVTGLAEPMCVLGESPALRICQIDSQEILTRSFQQRDGARSGSTDALEIVSRLHGSLFWMLVVKIS